MEFDETDEFGSHSTPTGRKTDPRDLNNTHRHNTSDTIRQNRGAVLPGTDVNTNPGGLGSRPFPGAGAQ